MQTRVDPAKFSASEAEANGGSAPIDFDQWLAAARRQAGVIAGAAAAGTLLALAYLLTAVPEYTAATDLLIDSPKDQNAIAANIADLTFDAGAIDSQVEVLKSEKIALSVVSTLKLTDDPEFIGARASLLAQGVTLLRSLFDFARWFVTRQRSGAEAQAALERSAVKQLQANLEVQRVARTYVLSIRYASPDPAKAAAVSNAFAEAYLTEQLDARFDATRRAAGWLQTRLAELKGQSIAADLAIQRYKAEHGIVVTGGDRPSLISDQQLTQLNDQIVAARGDTAKAEARYSQIMDLLQSSRTGIAVPDSLANPVVIDLRTKYLAASKSQAQLESKLGGAHLQVVALKREMAEYNRLIYEELQRIAESYRSEAEVARAKESSLAVSMSGLVGQSADTNRTLVQLRELERESETYRSLYQSFMQRYQEALQQQSFPVTEARVITPASAPEIPSSPKRTMVLALSLVVATIAGSGVAALREYRDRVFRTAAHVQDGLGLEFLGVLESVHVSNQPAVAAPAEPKQIRTTNALQRYVVDHPLSSFSETLRSAKVAIDLAVPGRTPKIVGVISALPGEGKSTVSKNLASLLAHLGAKTLLIDADLRNPALSRAIAAQAQGGLIEVLRGGRALDDLLLDEPDCGLKFLPATAPKRLVHTAEILASPPMREMLAAAGQRFDYIVLDLPPLGPVVDVRAAASLFDGFVFVAEWGRTARIVVQNLLAADPVLYEKTVGVVYNKVDLQRLNLYEGSGSKEYYRARFAKYYQREDA